MLSQLEMVDSLNLDWSNLSFLQSGTKGRASLRCESSSLLLSVPSAGSATCGACFYAPLLRPVGSTTLLCSERRGQPRSSAPTGGVNHAGPLPALCHTRLLHSLLTSRGLLGSWVLGLAFRCFQQDSRRTAAPETQESSLLLSACVTF